MEGFNCKGGSGVRKCTCIEEFKEELAWAIDKQLRVIGNEMLFKQLYSTAIMQRCTRTLE